MPLQHWSELQDIVVLWNSVAKELRKQIVGI